MNPPFEINYSTISGNGLFATRDIKANELIYIDEPIVAISKYYQNNDPHSHTKNNILLNKFFAQFSSANISNNENSCIDKIIEWIIKHNNLPVQLLEKLATASNHEDKLDLINNNGTMLLNLRALLYILENYEHLLSKIGKDWFDNLYDSKLLENYSVQLLITDPTKFSMHYIDDYFHALYPNVSKLQIHKIISILYFCPINESFIQFHVSDKKDNLNYLNYLNYLNNSSSSNITFQEIENHIIERRVFDCPVLYQKISYLNNACLPNVQIFGKFRKKFLIARKNIRNGEELIFNHINKFTLNNCQCGECHLVDNIGYYCNSKIIDNFIDHVISLNRDFESTWEDYDENDANNANENNKNEKNALYWSLLIYFFQDEIKDIQFESKSLVDDKHNPHLNSLNKKSLVDDNTMQTIEKFFRKKFSLTPLHFSEIKNSLIINIHIFLILINICLKYYNDSYFNNELDDKSLSLLIIYARQFCQKMAKVYPIKKIDLYYELILHFVINDDLFNHYFFKYPEEYYEKYLEHEIKIKLSYDPFYDLRLVEEIKKEESIELKEFEKKFEAEQIREEKMKKDLEMLRLWIIKIFVEQSENILAEENLKNLENWLKHEIQIYGLFDGLEENLLDLKIKEEIEKVREHYKEGKLEAGIKEEFARNFAEKIRNSSEEISLEELNGVTLEEIKKVSIVFSPEDSMLFSNVEVEKDTLNNSSNNSSNNASLSASTAAFSSASSSAASSAASSSIMVGSDKFFELFRKIFREQFTLLRRLIGEEVCNQIKLKNGHVYYDRKTENIIKAKLRRFGPLLGWPDFITDNFIGAEFFKSISMLIHCKN